MPRNERESATATLWQMKVLEVVARSRTWVEAESELGLNKYVVDRIIKRLAEKLGTDRPLLVEQDGRPKVPNEFISLVDDVRDLLEKYRHIERKAHRAGVILRVDSFPSHVEHFLGRLLGQFEGSHPDLQIEFAPGFGWRRDVGGAGLVADLEMGKVDLVVAPSDEPDDVASDPFGEVSSPQGLRSLHAYRWALVAAVRQKHPLLEQVDGRNRLDVRMLAWNSDRGEYSLVTSRKGHLSREALDRYQTARRQFRVETTSDEPASLIALGSSSDRVPLIASDSFVEWRPHWPVVTSPAEKRDGTVRDLGGEYRVYWRETNQPGALVPFLREFAREGAEASSKLSGRIDP
jgi:DNA-binding transcriptional LysR family regulator